MSTRRPKKRTFLLGTGILLVICAAGTLYVVPKFNQPVEGKITAPAERSDAAGLPGSLTLTTPYFTTQYPARYGTPAKPASSASLDAELLTAHEQGVSGSTRRIAVTVNALPLGGVTEDSSYHLFTSQPAVYTLEQSTVKGEPVYIGTRTTPDYERTYLWPHGKYLLTMGLTAAAPSQDMNSELQAVIDHVEWMADQ